MCKYAMNHIMLRYRIVNDLHGKIIEIIKSSILLCNAAMCLFVVMYHHYESIKRPLMDDMHLSYIAMIMCSIISFTMFMLDVYKRLNRSIDMNSEGIGDMLPIITYERYRTWIAWNNVVCVKVYRIRSSPEEIMRIHIVGEWPRTSVLSSNSGTIVVPKSVGNMQFILQYIHNHACKAKCEEIVVD